MVEEFETLDSHQHSSREDLMSEELEIRVLARPVIDRSTGQRRWSYKSSAQAWPEWEKQAEVTQESDGQPATWLDRALHEAVMRTVAFPLSEGESFGQGVSDLHFNRLECWK
jgi:hypothetical protein